jgi:hypothetical protein
MCGKGSTVISADVAPAEAETIVLAAQSYRACVPNARGYCGSFALAFARWSVAIGSSGYTDFGHLVRQHARSISRCSYTRHPLPTLPVKFYDGQGLRTLLGDELSRDESRSGVTASLAISRWMCSRW